MPLLNPVIGHQITVQIGNGASPEVFAHPVLINTSRGVKFTNASESDELVDTVDQSKPAVTVRRTRSTDATIDGSGMLHKEDTKTYIDWMKAGTPKNVKCNVGNAVVTGPFLLTSFSVSADRVKTAEVQITLESAGDYTVTASV